MIQLGKDALHTITDGPLRANGQSIVPSNPQRYPLSPVNNITSKPFTRKTKAVITCRSVGSFLMEHSKGRFPETASHRLTMHRQPWLHAWVAKKSSTHR